MNPIKQTLLNLFLTFLRHPQINEELEHLIGLNSPLIPNPPNHSNPYGCVRPPPQRTADRRDIVFISSRFRSGSTLLWNIFRALPNCTSYYEPFNERQWFNKRLRGDHTDKTHLQVTSYWEEYNGLDELTHLYREDWIRKALLMDASSQDPTMKTFITKMVEAAKGRPVFQFNRVDFRLPWLKHNFPYAKLVHLYRSPREQFLSTLPDKQRMHKDAIQQNFADAFYLDTWCKDLKKFYPFLDQSLSPHPYQRAYFLWKLSYNWGKHFADISIAFEDLVSEPTLTLYTLLNTLEWDITTHQIPSHLIARPPLDKWRSYASEEWFAEIESDCEEVIQRHNAAFSKPDLGRHF